MLQIFHSKRNSNNTKSLLVKKLFTAANQTKVVTKAARESAADQRKIVENYKRLLKNKNTIKGN